MMELEGNCEQPLDLLYRAVGLSGRSLVSKPPDESEALRSDEPLFSFPSKF